MKRKTPLPEEYEREASFLQALAHPVRLFLLNALAEGPRCNCDLEPLLTLDGSTVSRHLNTLKRAGILSNCKQGTKVVYCIRDEHVLEILQAVSSIVTEDMRQALAKLEAKKGA